MGHVFQIPDDIYTELATYAAQHGQTPNGLLITLLKQTDSMVAVHNVSYNPALDPLAPFIGAFDSGNDDPGWIERHDEYFARGVEHGE
jgi:hypothetical protein